MKKPTVYFIVEQPFAGRVKIGKSTDVDKRLKSLQTGNPVKLSVLYAINTDSIDEMTWLETQLHREAAAHRLIGEWFQLTLGQIDDLYHGHKHYSGKDLLASAIEFENSFIGDHETAEINKVRINEELVENVAQEPQPVNIVIENNFMVEDNHGHIEINAGNNKQCSDCGKIFRTPSDLLKHKNRKTPCLIREVTPENRQNPNRCIFCNKIFSKREHLTRHLGICKIKNGNQ